MNTITITFIDPTLASIIAEAKPPKGFTVAMQQPLVHNVSAAAITFDIVVTATSIKAHVSVPALLVLAHWTSKVLRAKVKGKRRRKANINRIDVPLSKRGILHALRSRLNADRERERYLTTGNKDDNSNPQKDVPMTGD